jgi:hypothetical protein
VVTGSPAFAGDDDGGRKNTLGSEADLIHANISTAHPPSLPGLTRQSIGLDEALFSDGCAGQARA